MSFGPYPIQRIGVFVRYVVSGVTAVVIQFGVLALMVEIMHLDPIPSASFSFVLSCLVNYIMLYYWAFKSKGRHLVVITRYVILTAFMLVLNMLIFWTLTVPFQMWYLLSQAFATVIVAILTFVVNERYTFNV